MCVGPRVACVLPSGVRRTVALIGLFGGGLAYADDPKPADPRDGFGLSKQPAPPTEDPRDVFGLKRKPAEQVSCADARTFGCSTATDPFDPVSPYALRTWLPSSYLLTLPVADARHDNVAHFAMGASRDDVGPSFAGATGLENTWTIEGAPAENLRTGNVETRVPLTFMEGMLVTAGGFAARDRVGLGGSIDVVLRRGGTSHELDAYVWGGFATEGLARPIANATYQLRRIDIAAGPETSFSVVATGPLAEDLLGGRVWYAAGIAGSFGFTDFSWTAARLIDLAPADGLPDGLPGKVILEPVAETATRTLDYLLPAMARAGWERGPHELTVSLVTNVSRDSFFLANSTQQAAGIDRTAMIGDGIATWKGTWKASRARVQLAWHRSVRRETAHDEAAAGIPQRLDAYVPATLAEEPGLAAACSDVTDDPYPQIPNCPIPFGFFASAGAGKLVDTVGDRPTVAADVARRYGNHILRAGAMLEDTRLVTTSQFTGGELVRSLFEGHTDRTRYLGGDCGDEPGSPCDYRNEFELTYRTRYTAAYIEETFLPVPQIRVDAGVRWELMWVGPRLHFSDQVAPRLGVAWDVLGKVLGEGSSRWWASMGRSHAMLPAGLGPTVIGRDRTVRDVEFGTILARNIDRGASFSVAEGIQPAAQDEIATGFEVGSAKVARAGVWVQRRSLRRGLDTVLANPVTLEANFDNPGRDGTIPALRESTVVAIEAMIAPTPKLSVRATYLWGQTIGSWTGPFDPRQGATLYESTDWDLDATNLYGRLPTDPGHRVAIEAERRGTLGPVELAVATRLTVSSGRPRNVLGDSDLGIVQLLPRGSAGRNPMLSQANVRLAARWHRIDFTLDVFNLFNRREPVTTNEIYAGQQVRPISGGTLEDLVFAKSESCNELSCNVASPNRRTAFGLPTSFQSPLSVVLGIHHTF